MWRGIQSKLWPLDIVLGTRDPNGIQVWAALCNIATCLLRACRNVLSMHGFAWAFVLALPLTLRRRLGNWEEARLRRPLYSGRRN